MLHIRFSRIGRKNQPIYRIVIMEKHRAPCGKYVEKLGFYNPKTKETRLNKERIEYWLKNGAQCSNTVHNLLIKNDIIKGEKAKSVRITKKRMERKQGKKEKAGEGKTEEQIERKFEKATEEEKRTEKREGEVKEEKIPEQEPKVKEKVEDKKEEEKPEEAKNEKVEKKVKEAK